MVNYWDKGRWTGSYSVEEETWMKLSEWADNFNRLYYCRIFPEIPLLKFLI